MSILKLMVQILKRMFFTIFSKFKNKIFILVLILVLLEYLASIILTRYVDHYIRPKSVSYIVDTENCKIQDIRTFYSSILAYINIAEYFSCGRQLPLVIQNDTHLIIDREAFKDYNIKSLEDVNCSYQYFWRKDPEIDEPDLFAIYGDFFEFEKKFGTAKMDDEFVRVNCTYNVNTGVKNYWGKNTDMHVKNYTDFFAFVAVADSYTPKNKPKSDKYNVLIMGLDSVSRLGFNRQMRETYNYITQKLGAVEFYGYTKLGTNTFPNLIPALTGQNEVELRKSCWKNYTSKFDNCSFIWKNFAKLGYVTAFAEECYWCGLFNYLKRGFLRQPVTHMWGTFEYEASKEIGSKDENVAICIGLRFNYQNLVDYALRFVKTYHIVEKNFFGIFWESSITHDTINYGREFDYVYQNFFENLKALGTINNTIIFLLSDHSYNMGEFLSSIEGRLEKRLPMFFALIPPSFQEKYGKAYRNILENSRKLTTHFDLYETLKDIANGDFSGYSGQGGRGISLFREIPENRSCEDSYIAPHFCPCTHSRTLSPLDLSVKMAVNYTLDMINQILISEPKCIQLELDKIIDASTSHDMSRKTAIYKSNFITVVFQTKISLAVFEATVTCYTCDNLDDFMLGGPIGRHNLYGNQSKCIDILEMRPFCYCKYLLPRSWAMKKNKRGLIGR